MKRVIPVIITFLGFLIVFYLPQSFRADFSPDKPVKSSSDGDGTSEQLTSKYKYIGLEKCASVCHQNEEMGFQYDVVKNSHHAEAYKVLGTRKALRYSQKAKLTGNPSDNQLCLKCHTTGNGFDPSSYAATYRKEDGVTCEACHKGPLSAQTVMPRETTCLQCHVDSIHPVGKFDYKERLAKISHPRNKIIIDTGQEVKIANSSVSFPGDGRTHHIGENYGGGIVFYTFDNGTHGLIAAIKDQGSGIQWSNGTEKTTGSTGDGIYAGIVNTEKILTDQEKNAGIAKNAAKICSDYFIDVNGITYDDWYLPSKSELNLLFLKKDLVGGFSRAYWSSTEADGSKAWLQYFNDGFQFSCSGKSYSGFVRAIRAF